MFSTNHPFLFLGHRFLVNSDHQSCHPRIVLLIVARNAGEILANQVYFWCQYIGHLGVTLSVLRVWPYIYDIKCLMVLLRSVCCFEVLMLCLFPYSSWEYGVHFKGIHFYVFKLLCLFFSKPVLLHHYTFYNLFSFYKSKSYSKPKLTWVHCVKNLQPDIQRRGNAKDRVQCWESEWFYSWERNRFVRHILSKSLFLTKWKKRSSVYLAAVKSM